MDHYTSTKRIKLSSNTGNSRISARGSVARGRGTAVVINETEDYFSSLTLLKSSETQCNQTSVDCSLSVLITMFMIPREVQNIKYATIPSQMIAAHSTSSAASIGWKT
jgi:hypothetical protein